MRSMLIGCLVLLLAAPVVAQQRTTSPSTSMISQATTTVTSGPFRPITVPRTYHAFGQTTAGAGACTIVIEVSNQEDPATDPDWILMGTITLTLGTTRVSDGFTSNAAWRNVRARITAISGTNATVSVRMGN